MTAPSDPVQERRDLTAVLASIVRGERTPAAIADSIDAVTLEAAERHGVLAILADVVGRAGCEGSVAARLRARTRQLAMADLVREAELTVLVAAFATAGVPALIFKGAQLAYTVYERPDLRPRLDTDLLVHTTDRDAADAVLTRAGYERVPQFSGDLVSYQDTYRTRRAGRVAHVVDLHWRLANPQQFGAVLGEDELFGEAVALPRLGPGARGLAPVHALIVACVHPVAHHQNAESLIWALDVHLVASRLTAGEWQRFAAMADGRGVARVCAHSLAQARDWFRTAVPADVLQALSRPGATDAPTATYLAPARRHIQTIWADVRTLSSWSDRRRLMAQHMFPSADYMRTVYAPASGAPLTWLYARRVVRGALKWLARS